MVLLAQKLLNEKADTGAFTARRLTVETTTRIANSDCCR
jgi:hypothetical protein